MAETKIYIPDELDRRVREYAMKRFGYGRGSISKAAEEALARWVSKIESIEGRLAAVVDKAKKDKSVVAVLLFGSYARKEPGFRDVDVALLIGEGSHSFDIRAAYQNLAGLDSDIEISILNDLPLPIKQRVMGEAVLLYVRDTKKLYEYSGDVITKGRDFKYLYDKALIA